MIRAVGALDRRICRNPGEFLTDILTLINKTEAEPRGGFSLEKEI
jgi:hypothetical protein